MTESKNTLKSLNKMFKITEHLKRDGGKTVSELATELDIPKSTIQVHLNTLKANKFVVRDGPKYQIGLRFLKYGMQTLLRNPIFPTAKSKVEELADTTGELAACFVEELNEAVYIYGRAGDRAIRTELAMGDRAGLHCTGSGKAILAYLPEERIQEILTQQSLEEKTSQTITDADQLRKELSEIRKRGYAYSDEESIEGVRSVAAPVLIQGEVLCSISLAGPATRFVGDRFREEIPATVQEAANEIELQMTYSESGF
jgi:DNA-binding IclR family transcriptional regulator